MLELRHCNSSLVNLQASSARPYRYAPLNHREIRLLKIVKTPHNTHPEDYSIEHIHLDSSSTYESVSYVWGNPSLSHTLDLADGTQICITSSLWKALPYLVEVCQTGYLWIDQITIDQSSTAERNEQVTLMGEIYSRSSACLVWMDEGFNLAWDNKWRPHSRQVVGEEVSSFFLSFLENETVADALSPQRRSRRLSTASSSPSALKESRVEDHLQWFFEHPWFRRTWVYQEFVLAPRPVFLIGHFELPVNAIEEIFTLGRLRNSAWYETFQHRLGISRDRAAVLLGAPGFEFLFSAVQTRSLLSVAREPGKPLRRHGFPAYEVIAYADTLEKMGASQAHDDRDHVFAFLGLAPFLLQHMRVDYSMSVPQCFAAMTKALVKESKSLEHFSSLRSAADLSRSKYHGNLPSWVPDWTLRSPRIDILCHDNLFDACGPGFGLPSVHNCKHIDPPTSAWNELQVAGHIIDAIDHVLPPLCAYQVTSTLEIDVDNFPGSLTWQRRTLDMYMTELRDRGVPPSTHISPRALLRTLLMDGVQWAAIASLEASLSGKTLYRTGKHTTGEPHWKKINDVISVLVTAEDHKACDLTALPHGASPKILHELSKVQFRRRVACCMHGRLALVPDLAERGDCVSILHGSRTPVVLRPRREGRYSVVGQCFYDGAMYGEMADADDHAARIFTLV